MFEVEPNLWLQALDFPGLAWLLKLVTALGYTPFYVVAILVLGFGLRLRPMLGVMLALILAGIAIDASKGIFQMPRPSDVDARVLDSGEPHESLVVRGGASGFLSLPSIEARDALRATGNPDYGFMSGHVGSAAAFAFGLLLFFRIRRRAAWIALCAWPLLMIVSRMYLGRHFLADAIGGLMVGSLAAAATFLFLQGEQEDRRLRMRLIALLGGALLLSAALPLSPLLSAQTLGRLLGLVVAYAILLRTGFPEDDAGIGTRIARVICATVVSCAIAWPLRRLYEATGFPENGWAHLLMVAFALAAALLASVAMARRLGLYPPSASVRSTSAPQIVDDSP